MEISKLQENGLLFRTRNADFVINPFDAGDKIISAASGCDFALSSIPFQEVQRLTGENRILSWPGEYEVKGVAVHAYPISDIDPASHPDLLFVIFSEQFKLCYLPALKAELHSDLIEKIGDVDLLIFPVTGDEKVWQGTLEEIEPKAILPMPSSENPSALGSLITKLGLAAVEPSQKLNFKGKSDFGTEKMGLFLLS